MVFKKFKTISALTALAFVLCAATFQDAVTFSRLVTAGAGVMATTGNFTATAGGFVASTSGQTLSLQEATAGAACMGTVTANGTTAVTTATTCAVTASRIFISRTSLPSGTAQCGVTAIVTGTSFDLDCDGAETGTFNWLIINEAA